MRVIVVGQTPPPYSGQAVMIANMLAGDYEGVQLIHVRMALSRTMYEVGQVSVRKILELVALAAKIVVARIRTGATVLYYPPHNLSRAAVYRDMFLLLTTRWMFRKTVFQYHAAGLSEVYPTFPRALKGLFRRAYFGADMAVRHPLTPDDAGLLAARGSIEVPYGIEDVAAGLLAAARGARAERPIKILFVGLLRESKGLLVLLDACRELRRRGVPFRLSLMGTFMDADFEAQVRAGVKDGGLEERVEFLGVLTGEAKHQAFAEASVFCFPSFFESESAPVVLLEAMQFALPIVATSWRSIPAVVRDGQNGFLVPIREPIAVADRLQQLIEDGDLRERMGDESRRRYQSEYTPAAYQRNLQAVFDSLR
jgi:glycosyltransferase involved in cell wall biosynthesis